MTECKNCKHIKTLHNHFDKNDTSCSYYDIDGKCKCKKIVLDIPIIIKKEIIICSDCKYYDGYCILNNRQTGMLNSCDNAEEKNGK